MRYRVIDMKVGEEHLVDASNPVEAAAKVIPDKLVRASTANTLRAKVYWEIDGQVTLVKLYELYPERERKKSR